jgi:two-component system invasion response regulator UvrY
VVEEPNINVVLVEDQGMVLDLLSQWLGDIHGVSVIKTFTSMEPFLEWMESNVIARPELRNIYLIADLVMPGQGGVSAIPMLKKKYPNMKIMVLSASIDPFIFQPIMPWADAIVSKNGDAAREIHSALRRMGAGQRFISPSLNDLLIESYGKVPTLDTLTAREIAVMRRIFKGVAMKTIAMDDGVTQQTISDLKRRVLARFHPCNEFEIYNIFQSANLLE